MVVDQMATHSLLIKVINYYQQSLLYEFKHKESSHIGIILCCMLARQDLQVTDIKCGAHHFYQFQNSGA
jgi:hypothetical protein